MIGIDASDNNPELSYLTQLAGVSFAIVKATEGLTFTDPTHADKAARARDWSKLLGHYHFDRSNDDGAAQARFFLSVAKPLPGETCWWDLETVDGEPWAVVAARAALGLATINQECGARCGLYTDRYELVAVIAAATPAERTILEAAPLWFADPDHPAGRPLSPLPWSLHQYGQQGGIDVNVTSPSFNWDACAVPKTGPGPVPDPAPIPNPLPTSMEGDLLAIIETDGTHWAATNGLTKHPLEATVYAELGLLAAQYFDPHTFVVTPKWVPATTWNALATV
ncbi:MAG TPA: glycoside hydrolase family 25 protein [Acidothermaceae bacterium]|jgi:lysozyme